MSYETWLTIYSRIIQTGKAVAIGLAVFVAIAGVACGLYWLGVTDVRLAIGGSLILWAVALGFFAYGLDGLYHLHHD